MQLAAGSSTYCSAQSIGAVDASAVGASPQPGSTDKGPLYAPIYVVTGGYARVTTPSLYQVVGHFLFSQNPYTFGDISQGRTIRDKLLAMDR